MDIVQVVSLMEFEPIDQDLEKGGLTEWEKVLT